MDPEVRRALDFAGVAHKGQVRKGLPIEPYITHPAGVVEDAQRLKLSVDAQVAAALHDVIEDTPTTYGDLERERFSARAIFLVRLLSKWWPEGTPPDLVAIYKRAYYAAIQTDPEAVQLKLLDRARNLEDMLKVVNTKRRWAEKYYRKTVSEIGPLTLFNPNPAVDRLFYEAVGNLCIELAGN